jgi:hypothetical protein
MEFRFCARPPDFERLWNEYRKIFGAPFYKDAHLAVFKL